MIIWTTKMYPGDDTDIAAFLVTLSATRVEYRYKGADMVDPVLSLKCDKTLQNIDPRFRFRFCNYFVDPRFGVGRDGGGVRLRGAILYP